MTRAQQLGQKLEEAKRTIEQLEISEPDAQLLDEQINKLLIMISDSSLARQGTHSVMEWWGVGKEFWRKMDVDEYIRKERESWR
jgi:hypothetical protein